MPLLLCSPYFDRNILKYWISDVAAWTMGRRTRSQTLKLWILHCPGSVESGRRRFQRRSRPEYLCPSIPGATASHSPLYAMVKIPHPLAQALTTHMVTKRKVRRVAISYPLIFIPDRALKYCNLPGPQKAETTINF